MAQPRPDAAPPSPRAAALSAAANWAGDIRAIVFDLDGTLYRETHHFDVYARELQKRLPAAVHDAFWADYTAASAGRHALALGRVYDLEHAHVLALAGLQTPAGATPVAAGWTWGGEPLPAATIAELYGDGIDLHPRRFVNIGDPWNIAFAVCRHYGLDDADVSEAFLATRDYMSSPEFVMTPVPGLAPALRRLRGRIRLVLATNSPEPCSAALLAKLDLTNVFDAHHFRAKKPFGMPAVLAATAAAAGASPHSVLSVGDNRRNDIVPAHAFGGRGVLLDAHGLYGPEAADLVLPHIGELVPLLEEMAA